MKWLRTTLFVGLFLCAGALLLHGCESETPNHEDGATRVRVTTLRTDPLSGAIFTTVEDGTRVNANLFEQREDVYLDGGPGPHAPAEAAGLPEGDFFFQVTDPSGKDLLSTDHITCRRFHVNANGVIDAAFDGTNYTWARGDWTAAPCRYAEGVDGDHGDLGAITVQLYPYDQTPNNGGVYKVWATRVTDYAGDINLVPVGRKDQVNGEGWEPGNAHGFVPAASRTDNYKVLRHGPPFEPPWLTIAKFHDADLDGQFDFGEEAVVGWTVSGVDPVGVAFSAYTPFGTYADTGTWLLTEAQPEHTVQTAAWLDGVLLSVYPTASPEVAVTFAGTSGETHHVLYGNVGAGDLDACKVYDRNGDGEAGADEPNVPGWPITVTGVDVTGAPYGPVTLVTDTSGCVTFDDLLPGTYTVSEAVLTNGWAATGATSAEFTVQSNLYEATVQGTHHDVDFTNLCFGTADFDTKGYWHNKNGLAELTAADLAFVNGLAPYVAASPYFDTGDEPFDGFFADGTPVEATTGTALEELAPAGTALAEVSHFLVDSNAGGDPNEQLAQQLLAFTFNTLHRLDDLAATIVLPDGSLVSASALTDEAVEAWAHGDDATRNQVAGRLDALNNNDAVPFVHYFPCTVYAP